MITGKDANTTFGKTINKWVSTWPRNRKPEEIVMQPGVTDVTDFAAKPETLLGRARKKSGYQDTREASGSWYKSTLG